MAILIGSKMRSKFVEHPVKPFAINLRAQVLIRTNPCKLGLVTNPVNLCLINQKPCALRSLVPNNRHENSASPLDLSKWSASWAKTLRQLLPLDKAFWYTFTL